MKITRINDSDCCVFGNGERSLAIIPGLALKSLMFSAVAIEKAYSVFSEDYTVCLVDARNNPPEGYSIAGAARDTAAVLDALGMETYSVIGVSRGGMIAQELALMYPEKVEALALCSTLCHPNSTSVRVLDEWQRLAAEGKVGELNRSFFRYVYSPAFREKHRDALKKIENSGTKAETERMRVNIGSCSDFDLSNRIGGIKCPVLVVGAGKDEVVTVGASYEIAERIEGSELYIYENGSHAAYDEEPGYAARICNFFEKRKKQ